MAKVPVEAPRPWVDDTSNSAEGRLGELFRSVAEPKPLSAATLAQIHTQFDRPRMRSPMQRRFREASLAFVMLLAGSSLAIAGWGVTDWWRGRVRPATPQSSTIRVGSSRDAKVRPSRQHSLPAVTAEVPNELDAGVPESTPQTPATSAPSAAPLASAKASALAAESAALEGVLVKLRRERNPQDALMLLDQSDALFSHGSLALEARVARVDALLALGRKREALTILERLPFAQIGRGGELRVVRAELRAGSDCALALADFDALTAQALSPPLAERALYGRAACELQVGDRTHAESDLKQYLARFPQGRFNTSARSELAKLTGKTPELTP